MTFLLIMLAAVAIGIANGLNNNNEERKPRGSNYHLENSRKLKPRNTDYYLERNHMLMRSGHHHNSTLSNPVSEELQSLSQKERDYVNSSGYHRDYRDMKPYIQKQPSSYKQASPSQSNATSQVPQLLSVEARASLFASIEATLSPQLQKRIQGLYSLSDNLTTSLARDKEFQNVQRVLHEDLPDIIKVHNIFASSGVSENELHNHERQLSGKINRIDDLLKEMATELYNNALQKAHKRLHAVEEAPVQGNGADGQMARAIRSLSKVESQAERELPEALARKVYQISALIQVLLPQLLDDDTISGRDAFNVRQTAFDYLPSLINNYLALPQELAQSQQLSNGKTAYDNFSEQLDILKNTLHHIADSAYHNDANSLLIHGRFLAEKFTEVELEPSE